MRSRLRRTVAGITCATLASVAIVAITSTVSPLWPSGAFDRAPGPSATIVIRAVTPVAGAPKLSRHVPLGCGAPCIANPPTM
jgi:hypothetical protein